MAEGPLVHYYVKQLKKVLQGKEVQIEFHVRDLKEKSSLFKNIRIQKIEAYGKQFRIHLSKTSVLLVHLMMWGSWRIYRKGEDWDKPISKHGLSFKPILMRSCYFQPR